MNEALLKQIDEQIQQVLVKLFTQWAQKQNKQQER